MWLIRVYYHEAHQDVCELGGFNPLEKGPVRGAERSRASSQRSEEHIQNLSAVICSCRGEANRHTFLFWCRLFLERKEVGGVFQCFSQGKVSVQIAFS